MYTKFDFGKALLFELDKGYDVVRLSRWAYEAYWNHLKELEEGLYDDIMMIVAMEDDVQFELTESELEAFAKNLLETEFMKKKEEKASWNFLGDCLWLVLRECKFTLPSKDFDEIIQKINHNEYLTALQSLIYYFAGKNIKFSKIASKYIREAAITMEINGENHDEYWLWEKTEPLLGLGDDLSYNENGYRTIPAKGFLNERKD
ncbi:MAG: hypothetical protein LBC70_08740 [Chitinispirillales bacterium]|jgi:hypothetical protein|nr:hypothetical protein [Chitinispirillales bacterium]